MHEFINAWKISVEETLKDYFLLAGMAFLICYVLFRKAFEGRKLQKKYPSLSDYRRDILYSISSMCIFGLSGALVFGIYISHTQIYFNIADRGILYFILSMPLIVFVHDTYFYWIHRLMHVPPLFRFIHKTHHLSHNPSPWTAYAFHPIEAIAEAAIVPLVAFVIPVHLEVFLGFFIFQIVFNVYGHLGYELYPAGFSKTRIGKWINTSAGHNLHHKRSRGNYGLYFLIWDRLMNTLDNSSNSQINRTVSSIGSVPEQQVLPELMEEAKPV